MAENKIRTIFIGTPTFSIPALKALIADELFEVVAVITQPTKEVGRKKVLTPPPIKVEAEKNNIKVLQPKKIIEEIESIRSLKPDLIVVVAYAQIIPEAILNIPHFGCINIHGSLLPRYRGAAVVQAAIQNYDKQSGVTIMLMDKGLDTGPILSQEAINLEPQETSTTLFEKLSHLGGKLLIPTLKSYIRGEIKPIAQDDSQASYVKTLTKNDGKIDWTKSAFEIERFVRAMNPWPSAWTKWNDKTIKITEVEHSPHLIEQYKEGEVFLDHDKIAVQCGFEAILIKKLQLEGKKEMSAEEFLRGNKDIIHQILT